VTKALIVGKTTDWGVWAQTAGWTVTNNEWKKIVDGFASADALRAGGFTIGADKYFVLSADQSIIRAKKNNTGIIAVKATTAVVIGWFGETTQPGEASAIVERVASQLAERGY